MPDEDRTPLKLLARDVQDLTVISSVLQDAIVPIFDMAYLERDRAFVMAVNRFRWEEGGAETAGERVHAGIRFDTVKRVQFRNLDRDARDRFASLLSIAYDAGIVVLHFSGGGAVRLEVDDLHCVLGDVDEPWPTIWRPDHATD